MDKMKFPRRWNDMQRESLQFGPNSQNRHFLRLQRPFSTPSERIDANQSTFPRRKIPAILAKTEAIRCRKLSPPLPLPC